MAFSVKQQAIAFDFDAEDEGELSVSKGQTVWVSDDPSAHRDGWTFVEADGGASGFVPTDFLEPAAAPPAKAPSPSPSAAVGQSGQAGQALDGGGGRDAGGSLGGPSSGAEAGALESLSGLAAAPLDTPRSVGAGLATPSAPAVGGPLSTADLTGGAPAAVGGFSASGLGSDMFALARAEESGADAFGAPSTSMVSTGIADAVSNEDFAQLFATHEEWFKQATSRRAETFASLRGAVSELSSTMGKTEERNNTIVQQISELDIIIDEERLKWQARLEKERRQLEKEKAVLAAVERGGGVSEQAA